jgi:hypothetical protein
MRAYCQLWPVPFYHIFQHYLIRGTIFGKMSLNIKCAFLSSLQILSEILCILRGIQRDIIINACWSSCKVPVVLSDFNAALISLQIFEKYANIKFYENKSSWSRVVPCGRTDRHDEVNSRLSQFYEFAWKLLSPHSLFVWFVWYLQ